MTPEAESPKLVFITRDPAWDWHNHEALEGLPLGGALADLQGVSTVERDAAVYVVDARLAAEFLSDLELSPLRLWVLSDSVVVSMDPLSEGEHIRLYKSGFGFVAAGDAALSGLRIRLEFLLSRKAKLRAMQIVNRRLWSRMEALWEDLTKQNEFLNMAVHDLRSPLTAMVCYAELLMNGVLGNMGSGQLEPIRTIHRNCNFLIDMVTDLLDSARLGAGKLRLKLEKPDFRGEVETAVASLLSLADAKNIRVETDLQPVPDIHLDTQKFGRVLSNLLGNAIKFTKPGGKITVRSELRNETVSLSIHDTGPGMAPAELETIFEKFELGVAGNKAGKGHGLGLAISKSFVELHGGRLFVESARGKGSVFIVQLPVEKRKRADVEAARARRKLFILDMAGDLPGLSQASTAVELEPFDVEYASAAVLDWGRLKGRHFDCMLLNEGPSDAYSGWDFYSTTAGVMNVDVRYTLIPPDMHESDKEVRRSLDFSILEKPCTLPELFLKLREIAGADRRRIGV